MNWLCVMAVVAPAAAFLSVPLAHTSRLSPSIGALRPSFTARHYVHTGGIFGLRAQSVEALVEKASKGSATTKAPTSLFKALKKKTGAKTVAFEFKRKADIKANTQFEFDELSYDLRVNCKVAMLVVDSMQSELSEEEVQKDIEMFAKEQSSAKGKFPGPVPIVWRKDFSSIQEIAFAKSIGCYSVTLIADKLVAKAPEMLPNLIHACHALGMEPLIEVNDQALIAPALQAGAKCINVRFSSGAVASFLVYATKSMSSDITKIAGDFAVLATVQARQGAAEIEQAQALIGLEGYNGVLFSGALLDARDKENIPYCGYLADVLLNKRSTTIKINEAKPGPGGPNSGGKAQGWGNEGTHV